MITSHAKCQSMFKYNSRKFWETKKRELESVLTLECGMLVASLVAKSAVKRISLKRSWIHSTFSLLFRFFLLQSWSCHLLQWPNHDLAAPTRDTWNTEFGHVCTTKRYTWLVNETWKRELYWAKSFLLGFWVVGPLACIRHFV